MMYTMTPSIHSLTRKSDLPSPPAEAYYADRKHVHTATVPKYALGVRAGRYFGSIQPVRSFGFAVWATDNIWT